ncbi:hypothetical protein vseg_009111 [Gypsophila vaccaria]
MATFFKNLTLLLSALFALLLLTSTSVSLANNVGSGKEWPLYKSESKEWITVADSGFVGKTSDFDGGMFRSSVRRALRGGPNRDWHPPSPQWAPEDNHHH